jgi:Flp pilus assembly protein CpaB
MEMEFGDNNRRGRFIVILGLILALVAGGSAFYLISQAQQQAGSGSAPMVGIVVAVRQIPARKPIEAADVAILNVAADATNATGTFTDVSKVVGLVPGVNILEGQPIYTNLLASRTQGGQFSILQPGETIGPDTPLWRAVALTVPDDRGVGGLVNAGDFVDIFLTATVLVPQDLLDAGRYYTDKATKITYQEIEVLSKIGTSYIVKVPLAMAEEMSHLQAAGATQFSLALRPAEDTRPIDASRLGETTNLIIQRYGLPVPQVYPAGAGAIPSAPPLASPTPAPSPSPTP